MKGRLFFISCFVFLFSNGNAQYAPQAGIAGSTAISAGSSQFVGWATGCRVQRGYVDIANPGLGLASAGDSSQAVGAPDHGIVSLGDSGVAVLTFLKPVYNGPGADLAIFENGFLNTANDSQAFLELAFVEVSSDGIRYVRFPSASLTQTNSQITNAHYTDARDLDNLAGKYIAMFGTPFDLEQLADSPGLDVNHINYVRLVDAVGSIGAHASRDASGRVINDPYPTAFPSCGFDLDAVGVINQLETSVREVSSTSGVRIYPNPATDYVTIAVKDQMPGEWNIQLVTTAGNIVQQVSAMNSTQSIMLAQYPAGVYFLQIQDNKGNRWVEMVTKR